MCIQQISEGKFRVILSGGYDIHGKRKRLTKIITAKSKRDAEKQATILEAEMIQGKVEHSNNITFKQLVDRYLDLSTSDLAEKTKSRYIGIIDSFLIPTFGKKKIKDISSYMIDEYIATLSKDGVRIDGKSGSYSEKTIRHHYVLLHRILQQAVQWDLITSNPCDKASKPKVNQTEARFYDIEQAKDLLDCLEDEDIKYRTFINLSLFSGARRSEVLGLEWGDINLEKGVLSIRRTSQYTKAKGIYTTDITKNGTPCRTVVIPKGLCDILKQYKMSGECLTGWNNRLFVNDKDMTKPMHPDTTTLWFQRFLKRKALPKITLHQIRHTSVSIMISQGTDINTIAEQRGHSPQVMLSTYAHVLSRAKTEASDKLQEEFFENTTSIA